METSLKERFRKFQNEIDESKKIKGLIKKDAMELLARKLMEAHKSPLKVLKKKGKKQVAEYSRELRPTNQ